MSATSNSAQPGSISMNTVSTQAPIEEGPVVEDIQTSLRVSVVNPEPWLTEVLKRKREVNDTETGPSKKRTVKENRAVRKGDTPSAENPAPRGLRRPQKIRQSRDMIQQPVALEGEETVIGKKENLSAERPAPAKVGRPKKIQQTQHMIQTQPAVPGEERIERKGESPSAGNTTLRKLARPKKTQQFRSMTPTNPAARKVYGGDPYEFVSESPENRSSKRHATTEPQKSPRQIGAKAQARRAETVPATSSATQSRERQATGISDGYIDISKTPERDHTEARPRKGNPRKVRASLVEENPNHERDEVDEDEPPSSLGEPQVTAGGNESLHPRSIQTYDDNEDDQLELDLLGEEDSWKKVIQAAREVSGRRLAGNQMPKLLTGTIRMLIVDIKEARTLYGRLSHDKGLDYDQLELREQLQDCLGSIKQQIMHEDISEEKAFTERAEMIRDIYARAVPALIFLLKDALSFHGLHPTGLRRYEALQEIVRLQEFVMLLCTKAKFWKAAPNTEKPIVKPTRSIIFPYTRAMEKTFVKELKQQRRKWKTRQNAMKAARSEEERLLQSQLQKEESVSEKNRRNGRILTSIEREREILRSSRSKIGIRTVKAESRQTNNFSRPNTKWTVEEEKELIRQLIIGYWQGQSVEDRYLAILNTQLLQNKLPEHVREQALALKPFLLEVVGALEPPVSLKWIESIT